MLLTLKKSLVTNFGPGVRFEDHLDHYLIEKMAKMPIFGHTVFKENHLNRDTNESFHSDSDVPVSKDGIPLNK